MPSCSVDGCERESKAKGLCVRHYKRVRKHGTTDGSDNREHAHLPLYERFMAKVIFEFSGCWGWSSTISRAGYAVISNNDRNVRAHRASYELFIGPIPDGLQVDHLCRVRHCVNPAHLELVTTKENTRRGNAPSTVLARENRCKKGHPLDEFNARSRSDGKRRSCRACERENSRNRRAVRSEPQSSGVPLKEAGARSDA